MEKIAEYSSSKNPLGRPKGEPSAIVNVRLPVSIVFGAIAVMYAVVGRTLQTEERLDMALGGQGASA